MTPKKPALPKYASGPSGKHKKPGMMLRAPDDELEAASRAAERMGVTRNDLARAALRLASREKLSPPIWKALFAELREASRFSPNVYPADGTKVK